MQNSAAGGADRAGRPFDVVLVGSGFYGRRAVAELLLLSAQAGGGLRCARRLRRYASAAICWPCHVTQTLFACRIGLAGRSAERLEAARAEILALAAAGGCRGAVVTGHGMLPQAASDSTPATSHHEQVQHDGSTAQHQVEALPPCDATQLDAMRVLAVTTRVLLACLPNFRSRGAPACISSRQPAAVLACGPDMCPGPALPHKAQPHLPAERLARTWCGRARRRGPTTLTSASRQTCTRRWVLCVGGQLCLAAPSVRTSAWH